MRRPHLLAVAVAALSAALVACGGGALSPTPPAEPVDVTGNWVLESGTVAGAAIPLVPDSPITFSVDGTEVGGQAACNFYGGRLELAEGQLRLGQTSSTAMLCGEPDGEVMRSEAEFLRAFGEVRAARIEGDRLTLFGPAVELVFTRLPPMPMGELVGTDWVLESVVTDGLAAAAIGEPAVLRLDPDGTFHGSTGCRTFTGTWIEAQGRLVATQTTMDGECPEGLAGQDGDVAEGLGGSIPMIEGDRLTLTLNGGIALIYRRALE
jgi:heat shock protein HslJ